MITKYKTENLLIQFEILKNSDIIESIEIIERNYFDEYLIKFNPMYIKQKDFNLKIKKLISHMELLYGISSRLLFTLTESVDNPEARLNFCIWKI